MSWFSSFLHPGRAYDKAKHELEKYYNQGQGYIQPYNQNGLTQGQNLTDMINKLKNPAALRDEWEKGYTTSEAAKNAQGMAQEHGLNAASSMGLMGSSPALNVIQAGTSAIGAEDKQNYLNDLMNKYQTGIGAAQNMYNVGAGAAGQQSTNAMNMGENASGLTFGKNNAGGQAFGQAGNALIKLISEYLTGGMGTGSFGRGVWSTGGK